MPKTFHSLGWWSPVSWAFPTGQVLQSWPCQWPLLSSLHFSMSLFYLVPPNWIKHPNTWLHMFFLVPYVRGIAGLIFNGLDQGMGLMRLLSKAASFPYLWGGWKIFSLPRVWELHRYLHQKPNSERKLSPMLQQWNSPLLPFTQIMTAFWCPRQTETQ